MSTFETHATASHRYYMRKTKAEIVQRICDMIQMLPRNMRPDPATARPPEITLFWVWVDGSESTRFLRKTDLAGAAMLAHELLGRVQAMPELTSCAADCDDMCDHPKCPQTRDGEPAQTGRHCPLHDPAWRDGDE